MWEITAEEWNADSGCDNNSSQVFPSPVLQERARVYRQLDRMGLPTPHAYRRLYTTHARKNRMAESVLKHLLGHSKGRDTTSRYDQSCRDEWISLMGVLAESFVEAFLNLETQTHLLRLQR
jgi:integrase